MNFLTSSVLSGILYEGFQRGASITASFLKNHLQGWLIDDKLIEQLTTKIKALELQDYGEKVIERKLNQSDELQRLLKLIKPSQKINIGTVNQNHTGSGDNVINKTIYKN